MRVPVVQDEINGFVWESQMRDRGGDVMELDFGIVSDSSSHKILLTKLIQWLVAWTLATDPSKSQRWVIMDLLGRRRPWGSEAGWFLIKLLSDEQGDQIINNR